MKWIELIFTLWRQLMATKERYDTFTYVTTSPVSYTETPSDPPIPDNRYFRKMIEKFSEYRETLADEKDKKEFDDFLTFVRASTGEIATEKKD